jgi:hypothetical protein
MALFPYTFEVIKVKVHRPCRSFPQRRPGFEPRSGHVGFVDKVALGQNFSEYFGSPCQFSFHRLLHSHHHHYLISGYGTTGQTVVDIPSGPSLSPLLETKKKKIGKLHPLHEPGYVIRWATHSIQKTRVCVWISPLAYEHCKHVENIIL